MRKQLVALAAALAGTVLMATPAEAAPPNCATTPIVAHRGLTAVAVENTMRAMQGALDEGVAFEADVRTTSDNRMVLMHDAGITRTTNGRGLVAALTARKIRSYRTSDGQIVPLVSSVLQVVRDTPGAHFYIELKALNATTQSRLADLITRYGIRDKVSAISFSGDLLGQFRVLNPGVQTYLIEKALPPPEETVQYGGAHVYANLITDEWRAQMQALGIPYNARLTNTPEGWDVALARDVDSIMLDDVAGYRAYCV